MLSRLKQLDLRGLGAGQCQAVNERVELCRKDATIHRGGNAGFLRQVDKALSLTSRRQGGIWLRAKCPEALRSQKLHELGLLERTVARSYYKRRGLFSADK